jgi:hypothetical protein
LLASHNGAVAAWACKIAPDKLAVQALCAMLEHECLHCARKRQKQKQATKQATKQAQPEMTMTRHAHGTLVHQMTDGTDDIDLVNPKKTLLVILVLKTRTL